MYLYFYSSQNIHTPLGPKICISVQSLCSDGPPSVSRYNNEMRKREPLSVSGWFPYKIRVESSLSFWSVPEISLVNNILEDDANYHDDRELLTQSSESEVWIGGCYPPLYLSDTESNALHRTSSDTLSMMSETRFSLDSNLRAKVNFSDLHSQSSSYKGVIEYEYG